MKLSNFFSLQMVIILAILGVAILIAALGVALVNTGFPPFVIAGLVLIAAPIYIVGALWYHARKS